MQETVWINFKHRIIVNFFSNSWQIAMIPLHRNKLKSSHMFTSFILFSVDTNQYLLSFISVLAGKIMINQIEWIKTCIT